MSMFRHAAFETILLACAASSGAEDIEPAKKYFGHPVVEDRHGAIAIRFWNRFGGEEMVQAVEIGPGQDESGARLVKAAVP